MTWLLAISLGLIEVVNGRLYFFSLFFARANGVVFMTDYQSIWKGTIVS